MEFYDVTKDPMKYYYIDKIQIVAVSKQNFIKNKNAQIENQMNTQPLADVFKEEGITSKIARTTLFKIDSNALDAIGLKTTKNDIEAFK